MQASLEYNLVIRLRTINLCLMINVLIGMRVETSVEVSPESIAIQTIFSMKFIAQVGELFVEFFVATTVSSHRLMCSRETFSISQQVRSGDLTSCFHFRLGQVTLHVSVLCFRYSSHTLAIVPWTALCLCPARCLQHDPSARAAIHSIQRLGLCCHIDRHFILTFCLAQPSKRDGV